MFVAMKLTQSSKLSVLCFPIFNDALAPYSEPAGAGTALWPQLPLDALVVRDAGHHGFDHVVDHYQCSDTRHGAALCHESYPCPVGIVWLHGGHDGVDAHHPLAALALRLSAHLFHQHVVAVVGWHWGGLSNDYNWVLVARVAEGLAAGVVQPIPAILILRAFDAGEQGRAGSFFSTGVVLAPAVGPSIGGLLVDWFGWRSIFFMVVPLALASIWMARRYVPTTAPGGLAPNREGARLDVWGMLIATISTLCLLNGLVSLRDAGWDAVHAWVLLVIAALGLALFVFWQHHLLHKPHASGLAPLMNLSVFRHRAFSMGSLVAFIYGAGLFGSTYLLPLYMQQGMGWSASYTGTALLPAGLMLAVTIALTGRLADRHPIYLLVCSGLALLALSFVLMATLHVESSMWWLSAWVILGRIGLGLILPSLNSGSLRGLVRPLIPQGSSVINFMRMLGGAVGVSVCAIVLQWRLAAHGVSLTSNDQAALRLTAFNESFVFLAVLMALALLAAWQLKVPEDKQNE